MEGNFPSMSSDGAATIRKMHRKERSLSQHTSNAVLIRPPSLHYQISSTKLQLFEPLNSRFKLGAVEICQHFPL